MAKSITILGRARLQKKLNALPVFAKQEIRAEMEKQADIIVALAKSLVPVASGALRESIGWTWGRAPKGSIVLQTAQALGSELSLTIFAGNDEAFYARWVEFGTVNQPAQPYFYVSYRASRRGAKNAIRRATRKAARRAAAG